MPRYAERTEVGSDRSRTEIERTLRRYGATSFAYGWTANTANVLFDLAGRRIQFRLPLPNPQWDEFQLTPTGRERSPQAAEQAYERVVRQRWRALALVIKAKLEAVETGITSVEEEFLAHIVLPSGGTIGEWAIPQIAPAYERGQMPALMPGGQ